MGDEEIMTLVLYSDTEDIEGMDWYGNKGGVWSHRANGQGSSGNLPLGGRPIGFRVDITPHGDYDKTGLMGRISIVYNACNCPASYFLQDTPFNDM